MPFPPRIQREADDFDDDLTTPILPVAHDHEPSARTQRRGMQNGEITADRERPSNLRAFSHSSWGIAGSRNDRTEPEQLLGIDLAPYRDSYDASEEGRIVDGR